MPDGYEDFKDNDLRYYMNYLKTRQFYFYFLLTQLLLNFARVVYVNFIAYFDNGKILLGFY